MNKTILSVCGAFLSLLCVIVLLTAFAKSEDGLFVLMAAFCAFGVIAFIGYGIDGTKLSNKLSNLFGEEASHE